MKHILIIFLLVIIGCNQQQGVNPTANEFHTTFDNRIVADSFTITYNQVSGWASSPLVIDSTSPFWGDVEWIDIHYWHLTPTTTSGLTTQEGLSYNPFTWFNSNSPTYRNYQVVMVNQDLIWFIDGNDYMIIDEIGQDSVPWFRGRHTRTYSGDSLYAAMQDRKFYIIQ